jgi:hypothetical protein
MPRSCSNCGHEVSISVNPNSQIADLYHFVERGIILKSRTYSKKCSQRDCSCVAPSA